MLRTPSPDEVADYLVREKGIDAATARFASHAAQGHVGRAKALARDESARERRRDVLSVPAGLHDLTTCMSSASSIVAAAKDDAASITSPIDERERSDLLLAWGQGAEGKGLRGGVRGVKGALKELEDRQKSRRTRTERDQLDRALIDLLGFYRDVLAVQLGAVDHAGINLINDEMTDEVRGQAESCSAVETMWRVNAIERARLALDANVAPALAMESLTIDLRRPSLRWARS